MFILSRARIEVGSSRSESIKHGTSVRVETIPCANYRDTIINNHENLSVPFEVRLSYACGGGGVSYIPSTIFRC